MTTNLRTPEAAEATYMPVHQEHPYLSRPSETLSTTEKLTDTDIQNALQLLANAVDLGSIKPADAVEELTSITQNLSYPRPNTPTILSSARRAAVAAEVYLHIAGQAAKEPGNNGMIRYDASKALDRAIGIATTSTLSVGGLVPENPISKHTGAHIDPLQLIHAIDHEALKRELAEAKVILRSNNWDVLVAEPLSSEKPLEMISDVPENLAHLEATALFEKAWNLEPSSEAHTTLLHSALEKVELGLKAYNTNEMASPIAVSSCRLLCAQIIHDIARVGGFGSHDQNVSAQETAIELLWEATPELKEFIDPKTELLRTPLQTLDRYTLEQLDELRETLRFAGAYAKGRDILSKMEHYRAIYSQELGINPAIHEKILDEDLIINGFGAFAVGLLVVVARLNATRPARRANALVEVAA